jgi:hypothetical protein|tara:strand:+ start:370 stop:594 length:225 start_codon:yes stop_codon:yes gene_type:complete
LDYTDEVVSVEELFQEELTALEHQYDRLTQVSSEESRIAAETLLHVIAYFRVRLGLEQNDLEELFGADPDRTIH